MKDIQFYRATVNGGWFTTKEHQSTNWLNRDIMLAALRNQFGPGEYMVVSFSATRATGKVETPVYRIARPNRDYVSSPKNGISLWASKHGLQHTKSNYEMMTGEKCTIEVWAASVISRESLKV